MKMTFSFKMLLNMTFMCSKQAGPTVKRVEPSLEEPASSAGPCDVASTPAESAWRCSCGSLLARLVAEGIELKCRRCKRTLIVPLAASEEDERAD